MSDASNDRESISDGLSTYSVDAEDQLQPEDTLVDRGVDDVLDEGYSPPDRPGSYQGSGPNGDETIEDRIRQEVPDPDSAYGAPENESGLDGEDVGGVDPDAIPADEDWTGDGEVGDRRAGRLVAPDQGVRPDAEAAMVADDVGIDGAGASAEEAAMHVIAEPYDQA